MNDKQKRYPLKKMLSLTTESDKETFEFGKKFSAQLTAGSVVAFYGNLGSGKTTCIRGLCSGLNSQEIVTSPTFTIINEYQAKIPIYHFDFYRLSSYDELHDLGFEEYLYGEGVCLIEWPEIVEHNLPANRYEIHLAWRIENGWEFRREIELYQPV